MANYCRAVTKSLRGTIRFSFLSVQCKQNSFPTLNSCTRFKSLKYCIAYTICPRTSRLLYDKSLGRYVPVRSIPYSERLFVILGKVSFRTVVARGGYSLLRVAVAITHHQGQSRDILSKGHLIQGTWRLGDISYKVRNIIVSLFGSYRWGTHCYGITNSLSRGSNSRFFSSFSALYKRFPPRKDSKV